MVRGNKNLVGKSTGGIFLGRGVSKFLAGRGGFPPSPPVGNNLPTCVKFPSQHFDVRSTLFQRCGSTLKQRCGSTTLKMKQNPTSDFQRCITLIQRQCPTVKQRRNNVAQRCCNVASTSAKLKL